MILLIVSEVICHVMPGSIEKSIGFVSKTLTNVGEMYNQEDKEISTVIIGVKKFFRYLYVDLIYLQTI